MDPIKIHIPKELFAPAEFKHYEDDLDLVGLKAGGELVSFDGPLHWQIDIANTGDAFLVTGTVEGTAKLSCSRCLDDVEVPVTGDIEGYYLINRESEVPDDLEEEEFEYLGEDNIIDIAPLIQSALLLEIPPFPLCSDECRGLCPQCGANLNEGECGCTHSPGDDPTNPFAKLKEIDFG